MEAILSKIFTLSAVFFIGPAAILFTLISVRSESPFKWFRTALRTKRIENDPVPYPKIKGTALPLPKALFSGVETKEVDSEDLEAVKQLYYKLHSLEKFPEIVLPARRLLISLLKETSVAAENLLPHENILSIKEFSRAKLEGFQRQRNDHIGREWEKYNLRRKEGEERELFNNREEAIWWLKQISPVKYVDGAWLGHIGKVTTPFALQRTIKGAWQILSEELGDGDLRKNHVNVYHRLLESVAPGFPTAEMAEFGNPRHGLKDLSIWKAAIAQLLVSLMPHEFLPEILGFNLHFEGISMDTLKAVNELKEVGIDPYYFILHVSIDNSHSGHSAIAIEVVCEYMDYILKSEGEGAAQNAWKKIQGGYLLSLGLPGTAISPSRRKSLDSSNFVFSKSEEAVMNIFREKSHFVQGLHCCSKVHIGGRRVADWLDPIALESKVWQRDLLDALSSSKYWIQRGASSKSRFIQELEWNGRMFGSFTQSEYDVLKDWVDNLPNIPYTLNYPDLEFGSDTQKEIEADISCSDTTIRPLPRVLESLLNSHILPGLFSFHNLPSLEISDQCMFEKLLPLWFSHPCLLQGFVTVPFRTKNNLGCTIVKILRAQGGFEVEQECIAGLSEFRRPNSLGLVGIGINMMVRRGLSLTALPSLKEVLREWPSPFAVNMVQISRRPLEYKGQLVGMATAFAKMHQEMAKSKSLLLSYENRNLLRSIASRELEGLEVCWKELVVDLKVHTACCIGYLYAVEEIRKCFVVST